MTRKSNRRTARVRNIRTLDEVLEHDEQSQDERQEQQQQNLAPEPTLLEEIDTLLTEMSTFEQMVEQREEWYMEQLSGKYMVSGIVSSTHQSFIRQWIDQRPDWENQFLEIIQNYRQQARIMLRDKIPTTPCLNAIEMLQRQEKLTQITNVLEHFILLQAEISLRSHQYTTQLALANFDAKLKIIDEVENRDLKEFMDLEAMQILDTMHTLQEELDLKIMCTAAETPYLMKKYAKYFQSSTGRIQKSTETTGNGNDAAIWLASFGENDTVTMEHQVCSICLVDFQDEDTLVRNAAKRDATKMCTHIFHETCITQWIQQASHSSNCPCCRRPFLINS